MVSDSLSFKTTRRHYISNLSNLNGTGFFGSFQKPNLKKSRIVFVLIIVRTSSSGQSLFVCGVLLSILRDLTFVVGF